MTESAFLYITHPDAEQATALGGSLVKTRRALIEDIQAHVLQTHPYDCPCVVALPVIGSNPAFLDGMAQATTRHAP